MVELDETFCAAHWEQLPGRLRQEILRYREQKQWVQWARAVVRAPFPIWVGQHV